MKTWQCTLCGFVYDEAAGMAEALLSVLRVRGLGTRLNTTYTPLERGGTHLQLTLGSGALVDTDMMSGAAR